MLTNKRCGIARALLLVVSLLFLSSSAWAQRTVSGTVTSSSDGAGVPGTNVLIEGTTQCTVTDLNGNYKLSAPTGATLVFSFIGFQDATVTIVDGQDVYNVVLEDEVSDLEEVVVLGYGVQKKRLVTGATLQVNSENIARQSPVNVLGSLQSQAPGVNIVQASGQPGEGFNVNIRGLGTAGVSTPLYVIDGIAGGDINSLNSSDIESIDVLKDAASAAIYGARAANGVVLITTKQGKKGKITVTYAGSIGWQNPVTNGVKPVSAQDYIKLYNKALETAGSKPEDFSAQVPHLWNDIQSGAFKGTNWLDLGTNDNALVTNHSINLSSGTDASRFAAGVSYMKQEGTLGYPATPEYTRMTVRLNSDHTVYNNDEFDVIVFGENATFTTSTKTGTQIGGIYGNNVHDLLTATPLLPAYNKNGDYYIFKDMKEDDWNQDQGISNPLARLYYEQKDQESKTDRIQGNTYLEINPIKSLKYKSTFGFKYFHNESRSYKPVHAISNKSSNDTDDVNQSQRTSRQWSWENTINWIESFDNHNVDLLVGQSIEKWGYGQSLSATNSVSRFPGQWNNAYISNTNHPMDPAESSMSGGPIQQGALASFFGRLNYNYNETYMMSIIMRADGSSNFKSGNRWGYFPSVSAGWVMTNESFMEPVTNYMDFFKLRGSWGQNGNCEIDPFQYLATIAFEDYSKYYFSDPSKGSVGAFPDILPNPDVTWETSEQLDLGFDARFFDSKLGLTFDWYKKTTKDWLVKAPALLSYGTAAPFVNGGDVENKGIEIGLTWNDNVGDLQYNIGVNLAKNKNEITRLANEEGILHGPENVLAQNTDELFRCEVGRPMGFFWGFKTDGVMQDDNDVKAYLNKHCKGDAANSLQGKDIQPGDLKFVDTDGDGKITDDDKTMIGNPHPDVTLGLNISLSWKGIDFSVNAHGAFGMQVAKSYRNYSNTLTDNYEASDLTKWWTGKGSSDKYPRFTHGKHPNMGETSDMWLEDADYLKINNITLGYDFKHVWKSSPFKVMRLYATLQNFITITGYSGMDPEVGYGAGQSWASGIDVGYYPNPKTFLIGANITF